MLELGALKGLLETVAGGAVSRVNAPLVALERGLTSRLTTHQGAGATAPPSPCAASSPMAGSSP